MTNTAPTFEVLKMLTSNGTSPFACANVASNTGRSPAEIEQMVAKGCAWLEAQAASVKAAPASARTPWVLAAARGAWLVAKARGLQ